MVNNQSHPGIQDISLGEKPEITDKENRDQLIEMAAEQFASLLWQQCLFKKSNEQRMRKNINNKEKHFLPNSSSTA